MSAVLIRISKLWEKNSAMSSTWLMVWLVLIALLARVTYTSFVIGWKTHPRDDASSGDAMFYQTLAKNVLAGKGYSFNGTLQTADKLPVYPLFIAATYWVAGVDNFFAVRWVQILIACLVPVLVFRLGVNLFDARIAWIAAILVTIDPLLIYFAPAFLAEEIFLVLLLISILGFTGLVRKFSWRGLGVASLSLGLTMLTRGNFALLPFFLGLWSVACWGWTGVRRGVAIIAITALVMSPWIIRNYLALGAIIPFTTNGGGAFYGANNAYAQGNWLQGNARTDLPRPSGNTEVELDRDSYRLAFQWIQSNPQAYGELLVKKLVRLFEFDPHTTRQDVQIAYLVAGFLPYGVLMPLVLMGIILLVRVPNAWLMHAVLAAALVNTLIFYGDSRFRAPLQPYLYLFGAWTISRLWNVWRRRAASAWELR